MILLHVFYDMKLHMTPPFLSTPTYLSTEIAFQASAPSQNLVFDYIKLHMTLPFLSTPTHLSTKVAFQASDPSQNLVFNDKSQHIATGTLLHSQLKGPFLSFFNEYVVKNLVWRPLP